MTRRVRKPQQNMRGAHKRKGRDLPKMSTYLIKQYQRMTSRLHLYPLYFYHKQRDLEWDQSITHLQQCLSTGQKVSHKRFTGKSQICKMLMRIGCSQRDLQVLKVWNLQECEACLNALKMPRKCGQGLAQRLLIPNISQYCIKPWQQHWLCSQNIKPCSIHTSQKTYQRIALIVQIQTCILTGYSYLE